MKSEKFNFQWFEKEDRRKSFRASVHQDGTLRLGKPLREELPPFIQIGFDPRAMVLAIADGHGDGISCPTCGVLTAQALCDQLMSTPATFWDGSSCAAGQTAWGGEPSTQRSFSPGSGRFWTTPST